MKPGFQSESGKPAFTQPSQRPSLCRNIRCCDLIPDSLTMYIQLNTSLVVAPGTRTDWCDKQTLQRTTETQIAAWEATFSTSCLEPTSGWKFRLECGYNLTIVDPDSCKPWARGSILHDASTSGGVPTETGRQWFLDTGNQGVSINLCCCPDSDGSQQGAFCWYFDGGGLITYGMNTTTDNCESGFKPGLTSGFLFWIYEPVGEYGETCCCPQRDFDVTWCGAHPCSTATSAMNGFAESPIPDEVMNWLNLG